MPSERRLSEQFRVARTSVREAMQGLVSLGVIERRGNRVVRRRAPARRARRRPTGATTARQFVRQLFETRRVLELPIVELAAERAIATSDRAEIDELAKGFRPGMPLAEFRAPRPRVPRGDRQRVRQPAARRGVRQGARRACSAPTTSPRCCPRRQPRPRSSGSSTASIGEHHAIAKAFVDGTRSRRAAPCESPPRPVEQRMIDRIWSSASSRRTVRPHRQSRTTSEQRVLLLLRRRQVPRDRSAGLPPPGRHRRAPAAVLLAHRRRRHRLGPAPPRRTRAARHRRARRARLPHRRRPRRRPSASCSTPATCTWRRVRCGTATRSSSATTSTASAGSSTCSRHPARPGRARARVSEPSSDASERAPASDRPATASRGRGTP